MNNLTESSPEPWKVDVRLPEKENSNPHGARPVYLIATMIKWIRTSRLSKQNSLLSSESSTEALGEASIGPYGRTRGERGVSPRIRSRDGLKSRFEVQGYLAYEKHPPPRTLQ